MSRRTFPPGLDAPDACPFRRPRPIQLTIRWLAAALAAALVLSDFGGSTLGEALAQTMDAQRKAAAEALFDEGRNLLVQGQYAAACERLEQSQRIDSGVGTLLYLGECYERLGKLASAWAIFREAASAARASGQAERGQIGDQRASALRPRLSYLTLLVREGPPAGYELLLDGQVVLPALFGLPFPVDAGSHQIVARAPGYERWAADVEIRGEAARQTLQIAALQPAAIAEPGTAPPAAAAAPTIARADTAPADQGVSQRSVAFWVGGSAIATLGVGVVLGLVAQGKDDEAQREYCVEAGCFDRRGAELNESARNWALAANIGYGLGVAGLATAAVLYFTHDADSETPSVARFEFAPVSGRSPGLSVTGRF